MAAIGEPSVELSVKRCADAVDTGRYRESFDDRRARRTVGDENLTGLRIDVRAGVVAGVTC